MEHVPGHSDSLSLAEGIPAEAQVRIRDEPLAPPRRTQLPIEMGHVVELAPVPGAEPGRSIWLLLAADGRLLRFDADSLRWQELAVCSVPAEPEHKPFCGRVLRRRLHVSTRGEYAAVVNDYGRFGQILDLRTGRITLSLDGGTYHPETVPFSFAFADEGARTVAVHRTEWNRLDLSDPATGELLSAREPTSYRSGEQRPEHSLDYFHGALYISPGQTRVLDDGWVWHPVGIPCVFSLARWLSQNRWESEDGESRIDLCARDYYWDHGFAWIDEDRVAVSGLGDDDAEMRAGVIVMDLSRPGQPRPGYREDFLWPAEIKTFAGPSGLLFSDGVSLYSSDAEGLSRWDLSAGERTGFLPGFRPTHHHRGAEELAQLEQGALLRWSTDRGRRTATQNGGG